MIIQSKHTPEYDFQYKKLAEGWFAYAMGNLVFHCDLIRENHRGWTFVTYNLTKKPVELFLSRGEWELVSESKP